MASFDALLEAAQFLEHRNTPGTRARAAADNKNFHAYSKSGPPPDNKASVKGEPSEKISNGSDEEVKTKRPGGHGTREVHNKLEKNRRAHLKECFENLRLQIPNMEDKKTSNLAILRAALRHINAMRRREKELEMFMQHLAREKIIMQDRIVVLKQELQELNVDVDLASFLKSIQETDTHSQSTATADGEPPIMSDVEEDDDGAPQQMVCVTVESTPYRSPTQTMVGNSSVVGVSSQQPQQQLLPQTSVIKSPPATTVKKNMSLPTLSIAPTAIASASSILATAAEAAQIKVVTSKPSPLSITNPNPPVGTTFTFNPNTGVISATPSTSGGKQQPLTLFNTATAGQNATGAAVPTAPSIVVTPTSRPPVTQILQQQLAQRALVNQAKMQQQQQQAQPQQAQPLILQQQPGSAIPQMITLNANQIRGLVQQQQQQQQPALTLKPAPVAASATTTSSTVPASVPQTFTLAQLPLLRMSTPAAVAPPPASPRATLATPTTIPTAIPIQQLLSQLNAGTIFSLPQQQPTVSTANTILSLQQPAAATTSGGATAPPGTILLQQQGASTASASAPLLLQQANSVTTTASPTIISLQPPTAVAASSTAGPNTMLSLQTTAASGGTILSLQPTTSTASATTLGSAFLPLQQQQQGSATTSTSAPMISLHTPATVAAAASTTVSASASQSILAAADGSSNKYISSPLSIISVSPLKASSSSSSNMITSAANSASLITTTSAAAATAVPQPLTGFTLAALPRNNQQQPGTVQLPSAQIITPQQLQQLMQAAAANQPTTPGAAQTAAPAQVVIQQPPSAPQTPAAAAVTTLSLPTVSSVSSSNTPAAAGPTILPLPLAPLMSPVTYVQQPGGSISSSAGGSSTSTAAATTTIPAAATATGLSSAQLQAAVLKQLTAGGQLAGLQLPTINPFVMVTMPNLVTSLSGVPVTATAGTMGGQQQTTTIQLVPTTTAAPS